MENNDTENSKYETRDRFAKLVLGTAAGFIAAKVVEGAYDVFVAHRRSKSVTE